MLTIMMIIKKLGQEILKLRQNSRIYGWKWKQHNINPEDLAQECVLWNTEDMRQNDKYTIFCIL